MFLSDHLTREIHALASKHYGAEIPPPKIENTNPNFEGDFTLVVFPYLRYSKKSAEQTSTELGELLVKRISAFSAFNVVKGFLNIILHSEYWTKAFDDLKASGIQIEQIGKGKKALVEYSSPNSNKPLHLGHIRNNVLGYSYCQILEACGFDVIKNNLVNDRGIHICKSMLGWTMFGNGETPDSTGEKGDHFVGRYYVKFQQELSNELKKLEASGMDEEAAKEKSLLNQQARSLLQKWEEGDPETIELWKTMNSWVYVGFDETYKRLGVEFDQIYYESDTYLLGRKIVLEGLNKGIFYKKDDGSVWVDLSDDGLDQKLLLRSDGTSLYITQDIGTAELKFSDFEMDHSVYVVGNEQDYHFQVLKMVLKKMNRPHWEGIHHLSYGMVDLPGGRMKTREGTVVDADDIMQEMVDTARKQTEELGKTEGMSEAELEDLYEMLGLGALKYFLLKVESKKRMLFDPQESIDFQGNTGPFIQYTHSRISSILRASHSLEYHQPEKLEPEERELIRQMIEYPDQVISASGDYNPGIIANALFELAKAYNKFYHQHSILGAETEISKGFRTELSRLCGNYLKHGAQLLGMSLPNRM